MSDMVGNPEDRFSQNEAQFIVLTDHLTCESVIDLKLLLNIRNIY